MNEAGNRYHARCHAKARATGQRCKKSAILGATVCPTHGGSAPQVKRKAAERVGLLVDAALDALESILLDERSAASDRIRAARDILDRAGLGAPSEVRVEVAPIDGSIQARLNRLQEARRADL